MNHFLPQPIRDLPIVSDDTNGRVNFSSTTGDRGVYDDVPPLCRIRWYDVKHNMQSRKNKESFLAKKLLKKKELYHLESDVNGFADTLTTLLSSTINSSSPSNRGISSLMLPDVRLLSTRFEILKMNDAVKAPLPVFDHEWTGEWHEKNAMTVPPLKLSPRNNRRIQTSLPTTLPFMKKVKEKSCMYVQRVEMMPQNSKNLPRRTEIQADVSPRPPVRQNSVGLATSDITCDILSS
jgi:hypothetical protein